MASLILGALPISTPPPHQNLSSKSSISRTETLTLSLSTPSSSLSTSLQPVVPLIYCGRGDKKTARGKRFNHSYGNARPRNKKQGRGPPRVVVPPAPPRKDKYDDGEIIHIDIEESLFSG